jgi:hypothetical protein
MAVTAPEFLTCRRGGKRKNVVVVVKVVLIVKKHFFEGNNKNIFLPFSLFRESNPPSQNHESALYRWDPPSSYLHSVVAQW